MRITLTDLTTDAPQNGIEVSLENICADDANAGISASVTNIFNRLFLF